MKLMRVGVDLAKNVFQVHGVDRHEKPVWRRRLSRKNWLKVLLETVEPGCQIGMESCSGAHHWARLLQAQGFTVNLRSNTWVSSRPSWKAGKLKSNLTWSAGKPFHSRMLSAAFWPSVVDTFCMFVAPENCSLPGLMAARHRAGPVESEARVSGRPQF